MLTITHTFVSTKTDGLNTSNIRPSNWNATHTLAGSLAGISDGLNTITFSATPVFNCLLGNAHQITLTSAVTASTVSNLLDGQFVTFIVKQDSTGGRTFVWPTIMRGAMSITSGAVVANAINTQVFIASGGLLLAVTPGMTY